LKEKNREREIERDTPVEIPAGALVPAIFINAVKDFTATKFVIDEATGAACLRCPIFDNTFAEDLLPLQNAGFIYQLVSERGMRPTHKSSHCLRIYPPVLSFAHTVHVEVGQNEDIESTK
jgi:hypothetical protein